ESEIGVAYLCGELRQGRIGVGYAQVSELGRSSAAQEPSLTLEQVDRVFTDVASRSGKGSAAERAQSLEALMTGPTPDEQDFRGSLLLGALRKGALEGGGADAAGRAAGVNASAFRRALMLRGSLGAVARALASDGPSALSQFPPQLFRPTHPMLAQTAESV